MRNSLKHITDLNFEDEQGLQESVKTIRSEYIKKAFKSIIYIAIISIVAITYFLFVYLPYIENNLFSNLLTTETYSTGGSSFPLNLTLIERFTILIPSNKKIGLNILKKRA